MPYASVSGATYADAARESVVAQVVLPGRTSPVSYRAVNGDATSQAFFNDLVAGVYGPVAAYAPPQSPMPDLRDYADFKAKTLRAASRSYTLPGGMTVLCDATPSTGVDLQSLLTWGGANPAATTNWVDNNGGVVTVTGAQCAALALAVLAYGQRIYAVLAQAMNAIANGVITTTAEIDALSWPT